jgi:hypothetical protein
MIKRVTFVVFRFSFAQKSVVDVNSQALLNVSRKFHNLVCSTAADFNGEVVYRSLNEITVCWNAFEPYPFHEMRGCLAALHVASSMGLYFEEDADVHSIGAKWGLCVNSGASVVTIVGSMSRVTLAVVGEALVVAQKVVRLTTVLQSNALVMEPCYAVCRSQIFCLPVDIVGQPDTAQLVVLEIKGKVSDFRVADYEPLTEGFSCMCFHRFDKAEELLQQCEALDQTAVRLLQLVRLFQRVQLFYGQRAFLSKPYYRQLPVWDSHEMRAEKYELDPSITDALADVHVRMPATHFRRARLPSIQPEMFLRSKIDNFDADEGGATTGGGGAFSGSITTELRAPFGVFSSPPDQDLFRSASASPRQSILPSAGEDDNTATTPTQAALASPMTQAMAHDSLLEFKDHKGATWHRSERKLGEGSFGAVYLGMAETGSLVAMKLLPVDNTVDRARMARVTDEILKEVALLSNFQSEYVVRYLSCAFVQRNVIVVMEYVGGGSLSKIVGAFGALSLSVTRRFAKDIISGLVFLHDKKVVHRDINPNNVLLTIDGLCKLSDFGTSATTLRIQEEQEGSNSAGGDGGGGGGGGIHGTPIFMAPEACRGQAVKASDIWSFGILLCYMMSGEYPYAPQDMAPLETFIHRIGYDENFRPKMPSNMTAQVDDMVRLCLNSNPELRPTAKELTRHAFFLA